jgi:hypothetical protein
VPNVFAQFAKELPNPQLMLDTAIHWLKFKEDEKIMKNLCNGNKILKRNSLLMLVGKKKWWNGIFFHLQ